MMRWLTAVLVVAAALVACAAPQESQQEPADPPVPTVEQQVELAVIRHLISEARPFDQNLALVASDRLVDALRADPPNGDAIETLAGWWKNPELIERLKEHHGDEFVGIEQSHEDWVLAVVREGERILTFPQPVDFDGVYYFVAEFSFPTRDRAVVTARADLHAMGARCYEVKLIRTPGGWRVESCELKWLS